MIRVFGSLSLALLITLYFGASDLKYQTQEAREELREVDRAIDLEKEAISVLSAEWSHLTRPGNLRKLAEAHLGLDTVRAEQIAAIEDVPWLGFNLFDQEPAGVPVRYDAAPHSKPVIDLPVRNMPVETVSVRPEQHFITIAQVEFHQNERWAY